MEKQINHAEWTTFLKKFSDAADTGTWPGKQGASEAQLCAAEKKLKVQLPPSYRAFLSASNGWSQASSEVPILRAAEDIRWFRKEHRDWYEAYQMEDPLSVMEQDYFNYEHEDSACFDVKHLAQALCVSEIGDAAVLLLNPMVVWPDGEWEVWFFANWIPGAIRYRSFSDWMRREYDQRLNQPFSHTINPGELPTVYLDAPSKGDRRIRPREEVLVLETVLERLKSKKKSARVKAAQQLKLLGGTLAVDALLCALKNDPEEDVRCCAADSLGHLGIPETVEALIAAVDDWRVSNSAIHALSGFKDERSAQYLLEVVEKSGLYSTVASHALQKRGDARGIEPLLRFLIDVDSKDQGIQHIGNIAGRLIAGYEGAGYLALEPLVAHPDIKVRDRASNGIGDIAYCATDKIVRRKAYDLLKRCFEAETNAEMRQMFGIAIEISAKKNRQ